jgi:aryl-alcohol dehydrogenase-like predicted oxidoreductase
MKEMALSRGVKPGVIALVWLLQQPAVTSVIVGARSAQQVQDNIPLGGVNLTDSDMRLLDHLSQKVYAKEQ